MSPTSTAIKDNQTENEKVKEVRGKMTIILPIDEQTYSKIVLEPSLFRQWLDNEVAVHPELFPQGMKNGYRFHNLVHSKKMPELVRRRIRLLDEYKKPTNIIYSIHPSFAMPYLVGKTEMVEKALFLRGFGVPYWALTYCFGHTDMHWYQMEKHFGIYSMVGTTVKNKDNLPDDIGG